MYQGSYIFPVILQPRLECSLSAIKWTQPINKRTKQIEQTTFVATLLNEYSSYERYCLSCRKGKKREWSINWSTYFQFSRVNLFNFFVKPRQVGEIIIRWTRLEYFLPYQPNWISVGKILRNSDRIFARIMFHYFVRNNRSCTGISLSWINLRESE